MATFYNFKQLSNARTIISFKFCSLSKDVNLSSLKNKSETVSKHAAFFSSVLALLNKAKDYISTPQILYSSIGLFL